VESVVNVGDLHGMYIGAGKPLFEDHDPVAG
jgi:hypothetical protein